MNHGSIISMCNLLCDVILFTLSSPVQRLWCRELSPSTALCTGHLRCAPMCVCVAGGCVMKS